MATPTNSVIFNKLNSGPLNVKVHTANISRNAAAKYRGRTSAVERNVIATEVNNTMQDRTTTYRITI